MGVMNSSVPSGKAFSGAFTVTVTPLYSISPSMAGPVTVSFTTTVQYSTYSSYS